MFVFFDIDFCMSVFHAFRKTNETPKKIREITYVPQNVGKTQGLFRKFAGDMQDVSPGLSGSLRQVVVHMGNTEVAAKVQKAEKNNVAAPAVLVCTGRSHTHTSIRALHSHPSIHAICSPPPLTPLRQYLPIHTGTPSPSPLQPEIKSSGVLELAIHTHTHLPPM